MDKFNKIQEMYFIDKEGQITIRDMNIAVSKKRYLYGYGGYLLLDMRERFQPIHSFRKSICKKNGLAYEECHERK
tara:strand:- start:286 stop:510 length:225 start_codon:yes stop_codon:yes gene_type:complete